MYHFILFDDKLPLDINRLKKIVDKKNIYIPFSLLGRI